MDELIANVVQKVGLDRATAENAVGIILNLFKKEGPGDKVGELMNAFPGADDLMAKAATATESGTPGGDGLSGGPVGLAGMLTGALGGGNPLMSTLSELQGQGLSVDQARQVGQEVASFAKDKAGADVVDEIAGSIRGLSGFL